MNERELKYWHNQMQELDRAVEAYWQKTTQKFSPKHSTEGKIKVIALKPTNRRA